MKKKLLKRITQIAILFVLIAASAQSFAAFGGFMIKTEQIRDPKMSNVAAATVAVPAGWKLTTGKVLWNFNMISDPAHVIIEVRNPKDDACFGLISNIQFAFGPYMSPEFGVTIKKPVSAADYITKLLNSDKEISAVKIIKTEKPKAVADSMKKAAAELQKGIIADGKRRGIKNAASAQVTSDCALVSYTCTKKGHRYEGSVFVGAFYTQMTNSVTWYTTPMIGVSAREGKLDAYKKDIAVLIGNTSINPAWEQVRGQVTNSLQQQKISAQQAQIRMSDAALQRQIRDNYDHITKTQRETSANRQNAMSNVSRGWTNTVTSTDTWSDGGENYSAPSGYKYAWSDGGDKTYYTNDSTFNPNHSSNFSGDWSQMKKTPW